MKRKCKCGEVHNFQPFKRFKTTFGGKTTHYQFFCQTLNKNMILTTTTYPSKLTMGWCSETALKKFSKIETLLDSETFINSGVYMLSVKEVRR